MPLFFSPFFTKGVNKNEVEVILKYDTNIRDYLKYEYMNDIHEKNKHRGGTERNEEDTKRCIHIKDINRNNNINNNNIIIIIII